MSFCPIAHTLGVCSLTGGSSRRLVGETVKLHTIPYCTEQGPSCVQYTERHGLERQELPTRPSSGKRLLPHGCLQAATSPILVLTLQCLIIMVGNLRLPSWVLSTSILVMLGLVVQTQLPMPTCVQL